MASSSKMQYDEYVVRVPKPSYKKFNVMQFNAADCSDPQKWIGAEIERDLSAKKVFEIEDDMPEFGAGSEYGRKQKLLARKLKYGMRQKKFDVDSQPWKLKVNAPLPTFRKNDEPKDSKPTVREFFGRKEGGIGDSSMYFMFTQTPDFTFEAHPIDSWYRFKRTISHRTLTDEEAEQMWDKRDKILNHLNFMARKRLHIEDEEEGEEDGKKGAEKKGKNPKSNNSFKIHDDEDMLMSDSSVDSDDEETGKSIKKKKKEKDISEPKNKEEALEDSDDGDGEGQEQDYNSDVSSEEEDAIEKRVAPKGLDEIESSSSSSEDEKTEEKNDEKNEEKAEKSSSSESDMESDIEKEGNKIFMKQKNKKKGSRPTTPVDMMMGLGANNVKEASKKLQNAPSQSPTFGRSAKRAAPNDESDISSSKRTKVSRGGTNSGANTPTKDLTSQGITEEAVRRYLLHKPITSKDLLKKFKTKKTGLTSEQIGMTLVEILRRLNPLQKKINEKLHFYLKE